MTVVYVAAGSNVDAKANIAHALRALDLRFGPLAVSPAYRNKAVGFEGDDFINLVVGFDTRDGLTTVKGELERIEAACGRGRDAPKWAPRAMDLDILLFGNQVSNDPGLLLPRPDLARRPYMLKPMADIAPDLVHPTLGKSMRELWSAMDDGAHEMIAVRSDWTARPAREP